MNEHPQTIRALSLGTLALSVLGLPAALSSMPGRDVMLLLVVGSIICAGTAWALARSQRSQRAQSVFVVGLSAVLGMAALLAIEYPAMWVGIFGLLGVLISLVGRARVLAWAVGGFGLWAVSSLLLNQVSQGRLDLPAATLGLVCLLAGSGVAWRNPLTPSSAVQEASVSEAQPAPVVVADPLCEQIRKTAADLTQAAGAINSVMTEQLSEAERQANIISDVSETLEAYQQAFGDIQGLVRAMDDASKSTVERSGKGKEVAAGAIMSLENIRSQIKSVTLNLATLARYTESISEIIASLGDLATQSSFVALNASIEAARAGQHGRGFAVVADEIRDLAQQSAESAAQVRNILIEIRQAVQQTAIATEAGAEGVETSVSRITDTAQAVGYISHHVGDSTEKAQKIAAVLEAQSGELDEVSASLQTVAAMQMQHLANARMAEAISKNLLKMAQELDGAVPTGEETGETDGTTQQVAEEVME